MQRIKRLIIRSSVRFNPEYKDRHNPIVDQGMSRVSFSGSAEGITDEGQKLLEDTKYQQQIMLSPDIFVTPLINSITFETSHHRFYRVDATPFLFEFGGFEVPCNECGAIINRDSITTIETEDEDFPACPNCYMRVEIEYETLTFDELRDLAIMNTPKDEEVKP